MSRPTDRELARALIGLGFRDGDARDPDVLVVQSWLIALERDDPGLVLRGRIGPADGRRTPGALPAGRG